MSRPDTVTLRVTSPCEHGKHHEITELIEGATFTTRVCRDSKGFPRAHKVTAAKYPDTVQRR